MSKFFFIARAMHSSRVSGAAAASCARPATGPRARAARLKVRRRRARAEGRDMTRKGEGSGKYGFVGKNTSGARKLLFFKLTTTGAFQHREARLSGARDGEGRGKFR